MKGHIPVICCLPHARERVAEPLDVPGTVERCPVCDRPEMVRLVNNWQQEGRVPIIGCGDPWHYDGLYDARLPEGAD